MERYSDISFNFYPIVHVCALYQLTGSTLITIFYNYSNCTLRFSLELFFAHIYAKRASRDCPFYFLSDIALNVNFC